MEKTYQYFESEFQKKLKRQLHEHRKKQNLRLSDVAKKVGTSYGSYQRWEATGQHLTDICTLLTVFQELEFSTTEIIDVLGLPPLTPDEMKDFCQDEDTLKSIKENGIYSTMRKECPDMDALTLKKILSFTLEELFRRLESRHGNP